jgi:hypothetical protein
MEASSPPESVLSVSVSDPVTQGEGPRSFVTFRVATTTDMAQFKWRSFSVIRRFRDFAWFHDRLGDLYPGAQTRTTRVVVLAGCKQRTGGRGTGLYTAREKTFCRQLLQTRQALPCDVRSPSAPGLNAAPACALTQVWSSLRCRRSGWPPSS